MIYGYARVSTKAQANDGNSLEGQKELLKLNGATKIYEDSFTGTKMDRPEFNILLGELQDGDTLIVTKLDRIARSSIQGQQLINDLINKGVKVNILNMGVMDNTPASELIRTIFLAFAQFERDMIVERTQEGKAIAKTKEGFKEGRPKEYTSKQLDNALSMLSVNGGDKSYNEVAELLGISKSTLIRENNKRKAKK
ncbi:recombinase family protein [Clostridium sp. VAP41]|uniref:recombinase family protein n=1 Tax=Clostridium sp. VAP41 TaxID=2949979 RepID=UPI0020793C6E|nr:recombinase family protein [Clostridium sp. VAP41]